jgi:hypothetical protein
MGQLLVSIDCVLAVTGSSVEVVSVVCAVAVETDSALSGELAGAVAGAADGLMLRPQPSEHAAMTISGASDGRIAFRKPHFRIKGRIGKAPQNPDG